MPKKATKKVTVLEGYFATGDYEAFCFDKHKGPEEHRDWLDQNYPCAYMPEGHPKIPDGNAFGSPEWKSYDAAVSAWDQTV
jgi:hypothetical protein